jgi:hypothetical protein
MPGPFAFRNFRFARAKRIEPGEPRRHLVRVWLVWGMKG